MAERITIIVEPSLGHGDVLTVQDAMRQVLDFIEVVSAATSDDVRSKVGWKLLSATTNSPFTAVAEAFSTDPDWPVVDQYAREAKSRTDTAFKVVSESGELPDWVAGGARSQIERIFKRNMNGVGRTSCRFEDDAPPIVIVERRARQTLDKMERAEALKKSAKPDWSGEELGSIDGHVVEATTHYGKPALRIRDRLTDEKIICLIPPEISENVGKEHDWRDVWGGQRVQVSGRIKRGADGEISLITAENVDVIQPTKIVLNEIDDPNITGGKGIREYLDELWSGAVGKD